MAQIYSNPVSVGAEPIAQNPTYVSPTNSYTNQSAPTATEATTNQNPEMSPIDTVTTGLGVGGWLALLAVVVLILGAAWLAWRASTEGSYER